MADEQNARRVRLLVVDDDPFLSTTLVFALQRVFPSKTVVRMANSLEEAADLVSNEPFNGVIVDHHLPDGQGTDFLKSLCYLDGRRTAMFLISGMDPNEIDVAELLRDYPQISFIEKPFLYEAVANQVREAVLPREDRGRGHYGLELFDLIQAYSLARKSATLRILLPDGRMGMVAVREGDLIHAALGAVVGQKALLEIARRREGRIRIDETCTTAKRTIFAPTEHVLIDTSRLLDEGLEEDAGAAEPRGRRVSSPSTPTTPPASATPSDSLAPRSPETPESPSSPEPAPLGEEVEDFFKRAFGPESRRRE